MGNGVREAAVVLAMRLLYPGGGDDTTLTVVMDSSRHWPGKSPPEVCGVVQS